MPDTGMLEKLRIEGYKEPDFTGLVGTFEAYLNPNEITSSYEIEYDSAEGSGTTGSRMTFKRVKPGDMTLAFFIDGTGADGQPPVDVIERVEQFQQVASYNGDIHRTNYLKIAWGTLQVKRCVLKSLSIAYKMFKPSGVPLRAVITAGFADSSDDTTRVALAQDESPDLTHMRLVKAGDNLPSLCYEIYGNPGYYLAVARANRIDQFRQLAPGTKVFFPPLEK